MTLPGLKNTLYWAAVKEWAKDHSDGCTAVKDWYIEACWEHDFHYRYGVTLYGDPISFSEANGRLREAIQMRSKLRWFSPLSWTRWLGVNSFGKCLWDKARKANLQPPIKL